MSSARAAATSGRSCSAARRVFFEGNVVTIVECPDRAYCGLHLLLGPQPRTDLVERQIRLLGDECEQPLLMLLERRAGVAGARLCRDATSLGPALDPADRRRGADIEQSCRLPCALAILDDRNHAFPKIIRVSSCHRFPLLEAFGGTESDLHARGNPLLLFRFTSSRKCSSGGESVRRWLNRQACDLQNLRLLLAPSAWRKVRTCSALTSGAALPQSLRT